MIMDPVAIPDLPRAVAQAVAQTPDTEMRIGKVVSYSAGAITVSISGSDILTNASYAMGQYQPALGDNVVVLRMGNQWIVLCTQSSNPTENMVNNYSFEDLPLTSPPSSWILYHDPASSEAADVDAITLPSGWELDGSSAVAFNLDNTAPGTCIDYLSSQPFQVVPGDRWTASAWVVGDSQSGPPCVRCEATLLISWHVNSSDNYPTVVSTSTIASTNVSFGLPWVFLRSGASSTGEVVPDTANWARVVLLNDMAHNTCVQNFTYSVYWDRIVARKTM